jgi:hypothetical protein
VPLPLGLLLAVEPLPDEPLLGVLEDEALPEPEVLGWSLELGVLGDELALLSLLSLLSLLFIARLPLDPDGLLGVLDAVEPDELPDCESFESLARSQADSPNAAARAAARAVNTNLFLSMSTISSK